MKPRNPLVVQAHNRRGGAIKSRKYKLREKELEKEIEEFTNIEDLTYWDKWDLGAYEYRNERIKI